MRTETQDLLQSAIQPFNIIEEFAALSPKRKVLLCEHLFGVSRATFQSTVSLLWPEAGLKDMKKLEKFLILLQKTVIH